MSDTGTSIPAFTRYECYYEGGGMYLDSEGSYITYEDLEAKIASGELRVVKKVQWFVGTSDHGDAEIKCNSCFNAVDPDDIFCRTCGGEIEGKQSDNS